MPQPAGIAARHAYDVRRADHLRGEMPGNAIRLQIEGEYRVEWLLGMYPGGDSRELRDERARHWNIRLRSIDRVGPMDLHRAAAVIGLAASPIFRPHVHAKRRLHLFGVGDDVDLVPALPKRVRDPVGAH